MIKDTFKRKEIAALYSQTPMSCYVGTHPPVSGHWTCIWLCVCLTYNTSDARLVSCHKLFTTSVTRYFTNCCYNRLQKDGRFNLSCAPWELNFGHIWFEKRQRCWYVNIWNPKRILWMNYEFGFGVHNCSEYLVHLGIISQLSSCVFISLRLTI